MILSPCARPCSALPSFHRLASPSSDERAPAGVKQMRGAAAAGKGGAGCSSLFKNCPFSARDIMAVVRAAAEENA